MDALMEARLDELLEVEGVGRVIAESIIRYFRNPDNQTIVERLRGYGLQMALATSSSQGVTDRLKGQNIVISGVFEHYSRDQYKALIEQHGGKNVGSISSKTSFILAGANMGPAKLQKAEQLGIKVMSEDEFLRLIND